MEVYYADDDNNLWILFTCQLINLSTIHMQAILLYLPNDLNSKQIDQYNDEMQMYMPSLGRFTCILLLIYYYRYLLVEFVHIRTV